MRTYFFFIKVTHLALLSHDSFCVCVCGGEETILLRHKSCCGENLDSISGKREIKNVKFPKRMFSAKEMSLRSFITVLDSLLPGATGWPRQVRADYLIRGAGTRVLGFRGSRPQGPPGKADAWEGGGVFLRGSLNEAFS